MEMEFKNRGGEIIQNEYKQNTKMDGQIFLLANDGGGGGGADSPLTTKNKKNNKFWDTYNKCHNLMEFQTFISCDF